MQSQNAPHNKFFPAAKTVDHPPEIYQCGVVRKLVKSILEHLDAVRTRSAREKKLGVFCNTCRGEQKMGGGTFYIKASKSRF